MKKIAIISLFALCALSANAVKLIVDVKDVLDLGIYQDVFLDSLVLEDNYYEKEFHITEWYGKIPGSEIILTVGFGPSRFAFFYQVSFKKILRVAGIPDIELTNQVISIEEKNVTNDYHWHEHQLLLRQENVISVVK